MSVRDKLSQREYGFNPAINPGSSFQDFIRKVPDYSIGLQHVVKHSEFKRPYDSSSYQDMEYQWDGVPGVPPYKGGGEPDVPWIDPGVTPSPPDDTDWPDWWPTPPPSDPGDNPDPGKPPGWGKTIVFNCWADGKYLMCTTTNIVFNCTQKCRWIKLKSSVPSGYIVSAKCNTISITAPECDVYGNIGPDFKFTIFTIAPNGEGFESEITIKPDRFSCEGAACNPCDNPVPSIGYTTQQMSVDETQNLSVTDSNVNATYTWAVTAGGGSVNPGTGTSTTYTAPASNAECANNPTITLSCDGSPVDTLQIAINAGTGEAYGIPWTTVTGEVSCGDGYDCGCFDYYDIYNCSGEFVRRDIEVPYYCGCTGIKQFFDNPPRWICMEGAACTPSCGTGDLRSAAQKTAGCCPEALL